VIFLNRWKFGKVASKSVNFFNRFRFDRIVATSLSPPFLAHPACTPTHRSIVTSASVSICLSASLSPKLNVKSSPVLVHVTYGNKLCTSVFTSVTSCLHTWWPGIGDAKRRILEVSQQVAARIRCYGVYLDWPTKGSTEPGAESAVYDWYLLPAGPQQQTLWLLWSILGDGLTDGSPTDA